MCIIAEREDIIKKFIPEEYWKLNVSFTLKNQNKIIIDVTHFNNKKFRPNNKNELNIAIKRN